MCRRNFLHGCCLAALGLGLLMGHYLKSWLLCCCGGIGLMVLGFCVMGKR
jgi:hypothetical protein